MQERGGGGWFEGRVLYCTKFKVKGWEINGKAIVGTFRGFEQLLRDLRKKRESGEERVKFGLGWVGDMRIESETRLGL